MHNYILKQTQELRACCFQKKINKLSQDFKVTPHVSATQGLSSQEIRFKTTSVKLLPPPQLSSVSAAPLTYFFHRCT